MDVRTVNKGRDLKRVLIMNRHYYISEDLDELEAVENELEESGLATTQIHVLSDDDAGLEHHHLHEVESVLKRDVVHSTEIGALVGVCLAALVLLLAWLSGLPETLTWVPFGFLAVVVLGFCTWEGGLMGIQTPHHDFKRFQGALREGRHVLFVDVDGRQEQLLERIMSFHPSMEVAGIGESTPGWVIGAQNKIGEFTRWAP